MATNAKIPLSPRDSRIENITPVSLRYLVKVLEDYGIDPALAFPPQVADYRTLLSGEPAISMQLGLAVIRKAIELTGDNCLGLSVAMRKSFVAGGLLTLAFLSSPNGLDAIKMGFEFGLEGGSMMDNKAVVRLPDEFEIVSVHKYDDFLTNRYVSEELIATIAGLIRTTTRSMEVVKRCEFMHDPGPDLSKYEKYFQCPMNFSSDKNSIVFDYDILAKPLRTADAYVLDETLTLLRQKEDRIRGRNTFIFQLERAIKGSLPNFPNQRDIAKDFALSERGLRRKLAANGTTFRETMCNVLQEQASEMIRSTSKPIDEIAHALGFSDARTFRYAFKNWTGQSPTQFRKSIWTEGDRVKSGEA